MIDFFFFLKEEDWFNFCLNLKLRKYKSINSLFWLCLKVSSLKIMLKGKETEKNVSSKKVENKNCWKSKFIVVISICFIFEERAFGKFN